MPPRLPDPSARPDPVAVAAARARADAAATACERTASLLRSARLAGRHDADGARREWAGACRREFEEVLRQLSGEDVRNEAALRALGRAWRAWAEALDR